MADTNILSSYMAFVIKQHAKNPAEYLMASSSAVNSDILYAHESESSSFRSCCPKHHKFKVNDLYTHTHRCLYTFEF